jgi:hypothetical protein
MDIPLISVSSFISSQLGLGLQSSYGTPYLTPVQTFVLKVLMGEPLTTAKKLKVFRTFRDALEGKSMTLSEVDYLDFLRDCGRASTPSDGERPDFTVLVAGRRGGLSTLLGLASLYDTFSLIEHKDPWERFGYREGALLSVVLCTHPSHCASTQRDSFLGIQRDSFLGTGVRSRKDASMFSNLVTRKTIQSLYFKRPLPSGELKESLCHRISPLGGRESLRGLNITSMYSDLSPNPEEGGLMEVLGKGAEYCVLGTSAIQKGSPFQDLYEKAVSGTRALTLCVPTWDLNTTVFASVLSSQILGDEESVLRTFGAYVDVDFPNMEGTL